METGGCLHNVLEHDRVSMTVAHTARIHRVLLDCFTGKSGRRLVRCYPDMERTYKGGGEGKSE